VSLQLISIVLFDIAFGLWLIGGCSILIGLGMRSGQRARTAAGTPPETRRIISWILRPSDGRRRYADWRRARCAAQRRLTPCVYGRAARLGLLASRWCCGSGASRPAIVPRSDGRERDLRYSWPRPEGSNLLLQQRVGCEMTDYADRTVSAEGSRDRSGGYYQRQAEKTRDRWLAGAGRA